MPSFQGSPIGKSPDKLNLTRMVNIMQGNAADLEPRSLPASAARVIKLAICEQADRRSQFRMHTPEESHIPLPRSGRHPVVFHCRTLKPVAALLWKSVLLLPQQTPAHRVFPVSCVDRNFPDIVPAACRTPCQLGTGETTKRTSQARSMPSWPFVSFIQH